MSLNNRSINMSNVDTTGVSRRTVFPDGDYRVAITKGELKICQSQKNCGKEMWKFTCQVLGGAYDGKTISYFIMDDEYFDQKCWEVFTSCGKKLPASLSSNQFIGLKGTVHIKTKDGSSNIDYWKRPNDMSAPGNGKTDVPSESEKDDDDVPF